MKKLLDRDLSMEKTLWNGIKTFFGFGNIHARYGCIKLGINKHTKMTDITQVELEEIEKKLIEKLPGKEQKKRFLIGQDLIKDLYKKTARIQLINAYRGIRLRQGLPCRGQRTHTNAKTAKKLNKNYVSNTNSRERTNKQTKHISKRLENAKNNGKKYKNKQKNNLKKRFKKKKKRTLFKPKAK